MLLGLVFHKGERKREKELKMVKTTFARWFLRGRGEHLLQIHFPIIHRYWQILPLLVRMVGIQTCFGTPSHLRLLFLSYLLFLLPTVHVLYPTFGHATSPCNWTSQYKVLKR